MGTTKAGDLGVPDCWLGSLGFAKKGHVNSYWIFGYMWVRMAAGCVKHNGP